MFVEYTAQASHSSSFDHAALRISLAALGQNQTLLSLLGRTPTHLHAVPHLLEATVLPEIGTESPRDLLLLALVLLRSYCETGRIQEPTLYDTLCQLYRAAPDRPSQYFTLTARVLSELVKTHGEDLLRIGAKVFLSLGLQDQSEGGEGSTARTQRDQLFARVCQDLGITDPVTQDALQFSGLGSHYLQLCFLAYARSHTNPAFLWHEYLHVRYRGLPCASLDEAMTEWYAFVRAGILQTARDLPPATALQSLDPAIDLAYYPNLQILEYIAVHNPRARSLLTHWYVASNTGRREFFAAEFYRQLTETFGTESYALLHLCHPEHFQPHVGENQPWINPEIALIALRELHGDQTSASWQ